MPFIFLKTNQEVKKAQEEKIKSLVGQAIEAIPGKNESNLLIGFEQLSMYLKGQDQHVALIEIQIFGSENHIGFQQFASQLTDIVADTLSVPTSNIYIVFQDLETWGVAKYLIDLKGKAYE